jgi:hypothetical protein
MVHTQGVGVVRNVIQGQQTEQSNDKVAPIDIMKAYMGSTGTVQL